LWSIYKHIFSRYLELHGCVLLPDTPQRRPPPLIRPLFGCRRDGTIKCGLLYLKYKIGQGRIRGIFGLLLKNLHFGICVRDDLKTKRNGRKNCSDLYFGCLATKINITLNLH
jgi:hypothetical protein